MSTLVTITDGQAVTTTLAIAEGTDTQHKNVLELVRTYKADLEEFGLVAFETRPRPAGQHGGADVEFATLNEQHCTLLLTYMRNSDVVRGFKKRLVKAFFEMARQLVAPAIDPSSLSRTDILRMALDSEEKRIAAEAKVVELTPKAIALDRFANHDGQHNVRNTGKLLGVREKLFVPWTIANDWLYRDHAGRLCAKADKIRAGYLDTMPVEIHRSAGIQTVPQPMFTQKGLARLAVLLARDGLLPKKEEAA